MGPQSPVTSAAAPSAPPPSLSQSQEFSGTLWLRVKKPRVLWALGGLRSVGPLEKQSLREGLAGGRLGLGGSLCPRGAGLAGAAVRAACRAGEWVLSDSGPVGLSLEAGGPGSSVMVERSRRPVGMHQVGTGTTCSAVYRFWGPGFLSDATQFV